MADPPTVFAPGLAALVLVATGGASADSAYINVYLALGEPGAVHVEGRVLGGAPPPAEVAGDGLLVNVLRTALSVASDELPGVEVEVVVRGTADAEPTRATTDGEGYFHAVVAAGTADGPRPGTLPLEVRVHADGVSAPPATVDAIVVPAEGARIVVADFDDTLATSDVAHPLLFAARLVLANGAQLAAVPGAASCTAALVADSSAFVVLSGEPVNFLPRLVAFLRTHGFPAAWFALRDFGLEPEADPLDVGAFKRARLERLAERLPHARFLLLGDSGEQDAQVYAEFRDAHPGRVEGIWIRDVGGDAPATDGLQLFDRWSDLPCDSAAVPAAP
jgi:phosphatidate phosphatase APP1